MPSDATPNTATRENVPSSPASNVSSKTVVQSPQGPDAPDRLVDFNGVMRRVPAARSTIYQWIKLGVFPPGRRVGPRKRLWTETEIDEFVSGQWGCDPPSAA